MNAARTSRQGELISAGKDAQEYRLLTSTAVLHPADLDELGVAPGENVCIRSKAGEAVFTGQAGNVPRGMVFVVYGPATSRLVDPATDGSGVPVAKGLEVEIEPVDG